MTYMKMIIWSDIMYKKQRKMDGMSMIKFSGIYPLQKTKMRYGFTFGGSNLQYNYMQFLISMQFSQFFFLISSKIPNNENVIQISLFFIKSIKTSLPLSTVTSLILQGN